MVCGSCTERRAQSLYSAILRTSQPYTNEFFPIRHLQWVVVVVVRIMVGPAKEYNLDSLSHGLFSELRNLAVVDSITAPNS